MRVGLVGCVKRKLGRSTSAADLYTSPLFVGRRRYVEASCDRWFVLSALHGLLRPEEVLAPYDATLTDVSRAERRVWSASVLHALERELGDLSENTFEIHAGLDYRDYGLVDGLVQAGAQVEIVGEGLRLGQQLELYSKGRAMGEATPSTARRVVRGPNETSTVRSGQSDYPPHMGTQAFSAVWAAMEQHQGEVFHQKRGQAFTYRVKGAAIIPSTTNYLIPRSAFEQAHARLPVHGPGELNDLRGPSYLYAILTDRRCGGA